MVDTESSVDVLFNRTYEKMVPKLTKKLKPYDHDLFGFNGQVVKVRGIITLLVKLKDVIHTATHLLDFLVVDSDSPYTAILGCPTLLAFKMVVSQYHLKAKFVTLTGVRICRSDQKESRSLYLKALEGDVVCNVETLEVNGKRDGAEPAEETKEVQVRPLKENTIKVDTSLPTDLK